MKNRLLLSLMLSKSSRNVQIIYFITNIYLLNIKFIFFVYNYAENVIYNSLRFLNMEVYYEW